MGLDKELIRSSIRKSLEDNRSLSFILREEVKKCLKKMIVSGTIFSTYSRNQIMPFIVTGVNTTVATKVEFFYEKNNFIKKNKENGYLMEEKIVDIDEVKDYLYNSLEEEYKDIYDEEVKRKKNLSAIDKI